MMDLRSWKVAESMSAEVEGRGSETAKAGGPGRCHNAPIGACSSALQLPQAKRTSREYESVRDSVCRLCACFGTSREVLALLGYPEVAVDMTMMRDGRLFHKLFGIVIVVSG